MIKKRIKNIDGAEFLKKIKGTKEKFICFKMEDNEIFVNRIILFRAVKSLSKNGLEAKINLLENEIKIFNKQDRTEFNFISCPAELYQFKPVRYILF